MTGTLNIVVVFFSCEAVLSVMNCYLLLSCSLFNVLGFIMGIRDANVYPFYTSLI